MLKQLKLFPLNGIRWIWSKVEWNTVYSFDIVLKYLKGKMNVFEITLKQMEYIFKLFFKSIGFVMSIVYNHK